MNKALQLKRWVKDRPRPLTRDFAVELADFAAYLDPTGIGEALPDASGICYRFTDKSIAIFDFNSERVSII